MEAIRNDAGIGMWLRGDGIGNFKAVPSYKSGLYIDGDVRDIELITINGKEILLTAKNNDYLQLVLNNRKSNRSK